MPIKLTIEEKKARKNKRDVAYNATHKKRIPFDLSIEYDADILAYLDTVPNKQGLIKELLRNHMSSEGFVYTKEETP